MDLRRMTSAVSVLLVTAICSRVILFSEKNWQTSISTRPEFSTPLSSFRRIQESVFYYTRGKSPYDGEVFHQPPIVLALYLPILTKFSNKPHQSYLFFAALHILMDLIVAYQLARLTQWIVVMGEESQSQKATILFKPAIGRIPMSPVLEYDILPYTVAFIYLLNPYTIASCVSMSASNLNHIMILSSFIYASMKKPVAAAFFLGLSTYLSVYTIMLSVPVSLHLTRRYPLDTHIDSATSEQQKFRIIALFGTAYAATAFGLIQISYTISGNWVFLEKTYGWILSYNDLTPNVGVFWYFFTEVFNRFVPYFLLLLYAHPFIYLVPLYLRLSHRPQAFACSLIGISAIFQSYPTLGDFGFYLSLSFMHPEIILNIQHKHFYVLGLTFASYMLPIMWYLWIYPASGNANFYYMQTLIFQVFGSQMVVASVDAVLRLDKQTEQSLKLDIKSHTEICALKEDKCHDFQ